MKVIKSDGYNFVVGLKWSQLSGENLSAEVSAYANESKCKYGVIRRITNDDVPQVQLGMLSEKVEKGWSAAGVLADLYPNIVLVDKIDDYYWVCAISSGLVLPGGDFLAKTVEEVEDKLDDILTSIGSEADETVYAIKREISDEISVEGTLDQGFIDIVDGEGKRFGSHNQIISIKSIPKALVLFGVLLLGCAGVGYMLMPEQVEEIPIEENIGDLEVQLPGNAKFDLGEYAASTGVTTSSSTDKLLAAAYQEEVIWLTEDFNQINNEMILKNFVESYMQVPNNVAGWVKSGAEFDASEVGSVNVLWNKAYGTGLMLKATFEKSKISVSTSLDGKKSTTKHAVQSFAKREIKDVLAFIKEGKYKRLSLSNDMDLAGMKWNASKHEITARPVRIEGIKDPALADQRQLQTNVVDYEIAGIGSNQLIYLSSILKRAETFLVTRIVVEGENQSWKVYGELYE